MQFPYEPVKVLVVDDEQDIRDGSERILTRLGCEVRTCPRGDKALEIIQDEPASMVLLDLKMPGMDGMEVLKRIRRMDETILVIMITGYATVQTAIEAMKAGAYDFIPKPFEPDQLRIVANRAIEKVRLRTAAQALEAQRKRTLADLDKEKSRIRTILESLPDGVMVTDTKGRAVLLNPAFRQLLNLPDTAEAGDPVESYIPDAELCVIIKEISQGKHIDFDDIPDYDFNLPNDTYLMARALPVLGENMECLGAVINFVDITAFKVIDRLKSEFVAKVSHELRSPLSTIHEQLALVIRDMMGAASQQNQHILTRAKEKTQTLISMIGDLLDLSRIEEGLICNEPKRVQVGEILTGVVEFLSTRAKQKQQCIGLHLPDLPLPELVADPLALESIFGNLITNAITYTQEGGRIDVSAALTGVNIRISVKDNGFGIGEKHLSMIFDRFYRVKDEKTRYITGTGLGLSIVKGLVEALGGYIDVESTPGKGSVFTVLLPTEAY